MHESFIAQTVRRLALRRIEQTKISLEKEYAWFAELTEQDKLYYALQVVGAQKSILQMGRIMWDLVPTVLSIIAIVLAFWKK